jgi:hypothetical protein
MNGIGIKKIVTVYLAIVFSYYYVINLDKVAAD